jgi:hypothetical protein
MRIGPVESEWPHERPDGDCKECGGQCDGGDCGLHAAGCMYGGFGEGYWLIADGCPLWHGETTLGVSKGGG